MDGKKVYFVEDDQIYTATRVKIIGEGDPKWTKDRETIWKGEVLETGNHYRKGEVIFSREENIYNTREKIVELENNIKEDLEFNN